VKEKEKENVTEGEKGKRSSSTLLGLLYKTALAVARKGEGGGKKKKKEKRERKSPWGEVIHCPEEERIREPVGISAFRCEGRGKERKGRPPAISAGFRIFRRPRKGGEKRGKKKEARR